MASEAAGYFVERKANGADGAVGWVIGYRKASGSVIAAGCVVSYPGVKRLEAWMDTGDGLNDGLAYRQRIEAVGRYEAAVKETGR